MPADGMLTVYEEEGVNICDKEQKGFILRRAECVEHVVEPDALINDAIQRRKSINILLMNSGDAFGRISDDLIKMNLEQLGLPENIIRLIISSFEDSYIQIQAKSGNTGRIDIGKGV
jgi:hypothetical protein